MMACVGKDRISRKFALPLHPAIVYKSILVGQGLIYGWIVGELGWGPRVDQEKLRNFITASLIDPLSQMSHIFTLPITK